MESEDEETALDHVDTAGGEQVFIEVDSSGKSSTPSQLREEGRMVHVAESKDEWERDEASRVEAVLDYADKETKRIEEECMRRAIS